MASKEEGSVIGQVKDGFIVARLAYDALLYTLPKCGFPITRIPVTKLEKNIYKRANFEMIAGASALRIALAQRDKWKHMFISRRNSSGFKNDEIVLFLWNIVLCTPLSRGGTLENIVPVTLALCNEIILFFFSEDISSNFFEVICSVGSIIRNRIGFKENFLETLEGLFENFVDIFKYTESITEFVRKYAVPYGAREVSERFSQADDLIDFDTAIIPPKNPIIENVKEKLGFLPHEFIEPGDYIVVPQSIILSTGSSLPGDRESPEPPVLPAIPERVSQSNQAKKRKKSKKKN